MTDKKNTDGLDDDIKLDDNGMPIEENLDEIDPIDDDELDPISVIEEQLASEGEDYSEAHAYSESGEDLDTLEQQLAQSGVDLSVDEELGGDASLPEETVSQDNSEEIVEMDEDQVDRYLAEIEQEIAEEEALAHNNEESGVSEPEQEEVSVETSDEDIDEDELYEALEAEDKAAETVEDATNNTTEADVEENVVQSDMSSPLEQTFIEGGDSPVVTTEMEETPSMTSEPVEAAEEPGQQLSIDELNEIQNQADSENSETSETQAEEDDTDFARFFDAEDAKNKANYDTDSVDLDGDSGIKKLSETTVREPITELSENDVYAQPDDLDDGSEQAEEEIVYVDEDGNEVSEYEEEDYQLADDDFDEEVDEGDIEDYAAEEPDDEEDEDYELSDIPLPQKEAAKTGLFSNLGIAHYSVMGIVGVAAVLFGIGAMNKNSLRSQQVTQTTQPPAVQEVEPQPQSERQYTADEESTIQETIAAVNSATGTKPTQTTPNTEQLDYNEAKSFVDKARNGLSPMESRNTGRMDSALQTFDKTNAKIFAGMLERLQQIENNQKDMFEANRILGESVTILDTRVNKQRQDFESVANNAQKTQAAFKPKRYTANAQMGYGQRDYALYQQGLGQNSSNTSYVSEQSAKPSKRKSTNKAAKPKPLKVQLAQLSEKPIHPYLRAITVTNKKAVIADVSCNRKVVKVGSRVTKSEKVVGFLSTDVYTNKHRIPTMNKNGC